jgi:hypothetical protein
VNFTLSLLGQPSQLGPVSLLTMVSNIPVSKPRLIYIAVKGVPGTAQELSDHCLYHACYCPTGHSKLHGLAHSQCETGLPKDLDVGS